MYFFPYLEPACCSMSSSNCHFLTCTQISQEAGQVVWYSHLFQNFPQLIVIHTVKGFGIVNKAKLDVFLELSCFFHDPADVGNLISGSSAFSKTSLNIRKFTVHVLLKPGLEIYNNIKFLKMLNIHGQSLQSYQTLCDPLDCRPPCSPAHGIFQARVLELVAISSSRRLFPTRDQTYISCISWALQGISLPLSHCGRPKC